MHISKLNISNFRAFENLTINFQKGVNIIIGENNSGKSAIIDALRICLGYGKSDNNNIYVQESDLYVDSTDTSKKTNAIRFDLIFDIDDTQPIERACFYDFISQDPEDPAKQTIQLHIKYVLETKGKRSYFKRIVWGGDNEGQIVPYESLQEIFYTYLSPLRDAINSLRPYSYDNKTATLFNQLTRYTGKDNIVILNDEKKKELANKLYSAFESDEHEWKFILSEGMNKVNAHLEGTGIKDKNPNISMNFVGRKYSDVVRGIELKSPIYLEEILGGNEQKYFELNQNGLGENNLIYASVVLGDLINRCEDNELEIYNALLVEEPEAHLHPQYQNTFFEYLNKLKDKGLQIFVTSHSPTITAKSDLNNITVLQRKEAEIKSFSFRDLTEMDFSTVNRKHLRKFLDTTKAQMFFSSGTILVEGIAEGVLIPILSKKFMAEKVDLEKRGVELVNIGGVAFEHFGKLYNNDDENKRLYSNCSIITDADPTTEKAISDRASNAQQLAKGNLKVFIASHTFEYDLFETSQRNKTIMRSVYRSMHPKTPDLKGDFTVDTLMEKLASNKDKAEFALQLFYKLESTPEFDVPNYIKNAITFVVS